METYVNLRIGGEPGALDKARSLVEGIERNDHDHVMSLLADTSLDPASLESQLSAEDFWSPDHLDTSGKVIELSYVCGSDGFDHLHRMLIIFNAIGGLDVHSRFTHDEDVDDDGDLYVWLSGGKAVAYRAWSEDDEAWPDHGQGTGRKNLDVSSFEPLEPEFSEEEIERAVASMFDPEARGTSFLGALFRNILISGLFTVVTVVLFQPMWLWIALGVILLIGLTIWAVMGVSQVQAAERELEDELEGVPEAHREALAKVFTEVAMRQERKANRLLNEEEQS